MQDDRLSPVTFYVGLGATAVLGGFTAWSGLDALAERRKFDDAPAEYDPSVVHSKATRTDGLLVATVLVGGATAYLGFRLVNSTRQQPNMSSPSVAVAFHPVASGGGLFGILRF